MVLLVVVLVVVVDVLVERWRVCLVILVVAVNWSRDRVSLGMDYCFFRLYY